MRYLSNVTGALTLAGAFAIQSLVGPSTALAFGSIYGRIMAPEGSGLTLSAESIRDLPVNLHNQYTGVVQTARTDQAGAFSFTNTARGFYLVDATLGDRSFQRLVPYQDSLQDVEVNINAAPAEYSGPHIGGVVSAAHYRSNKVKQSDLAQSSLAVVFGNYFKPEALTLAKTVPLSPRLGAFAAYLLQDGVRHDTYPVYASKTQAAVVIPGGLRPGLASFHVEGGAVGLEVRIVPHQPGFYTRTQNGLGLAICAHSDYSPVTLDHPSQPGENIFCAGTGFGKSTADDTGVVYDKRSTFQYRAWLGKEPVQFQFAGSAGYAGSDQINFKVSPNSAEGCNIPFFAVVNDRYASPPVGIPVSKSGPCSDPLGLNAEYVHQLASSDITNLSVRWGQYSLRDPQTSTDRFLAQASATRFTLSSYLANPAKGTCTYQYLPKGYTNPNRLSLTGAIIVSLPGTLFTLSENGNSGAYVNQYALSNTIGEGIYSIKLQSLLVDGASYTTSLTGSDFTRAPDHDMQDFIDRVSQLPPEEMATLGEFLAAIAGVRPPSDRVLRLTSQAFQAGDGGQHSLNCQDFSGPDQVVNDLQKFLIPEAAFKTTVVRSLDIVPHEATSGDDRERLVLEPVADYVRRLDWSTTENLRADPFGY